MATTIRAAALTGFADLAREVGIDPLRALDAVGIPRAALTDPDTRISGSAVRDLYETCGERVEDFALRLMERRRLSIMGPVMLVVREQPTVRAALAAIMNHNALHNETMTLRLEEFEDVAVIILITNFDRPGPLRQAAEASLAQVVRILRLFLGSGWQPASVAFVHSPPSNLETHRRSCGHNLAFDQDRYAVVCERGDLERRNEAADPELARQIETYVRSLGRPAADDVAARVAENLGVLLGAGRGNVGAVARQMAIDPRTLQRQLARDGLTFGGILQRVRIDLAAQYLDGGARPLVEVAELLGFSALSAFSRWHRAQYGQSPSERRAGGKT